ncbi:MAG TPA: thiamine pyrophosphate-dependent enzyme, partial [Mycobacteriales bacterium]|nr:thiamine pyrophosphate-dependent enzyme [Mycobacteriales bacterium]
VLVVGRVGLSRPLLEWLAGVPHVVLSPDGGPWDVTRAAQAVVYAPADVLAKVDVPPAPAEWALAWHSAAGSVAAAVDAALDETDRLSEPRVARDVAHLVPDGTALVVSSSMPIRDLDVVMHPRETIQVLANRGVSGIDGFVSTAQGIAIARAGGPTVALCGDLSLLHDSNGLLPGPDRRPDVTYIVINNDGGGIFSLLPQRSAVAPADFERLFGTPHGLSLERFAAAYDVEHRLVTHAAGLADLLSNPSGLRIVEIRTDRGENAALHARLRAINPHL